MGLAGRLRAMLILPAALALVFASCASQQQAPAVATSPTPDRQTPGAPVDAPEVGVPEELAFEAPLLGGGTFRGSDYAGQGLALWFWAPW